MTGLPKTDRGSRPVRARIAVALVFGLLLQMTRAATFVVTSTADSGAGTLRQAILDSEGTAGNDLITFNLPGGGPYAIRPVAPLPAIREPVTLDGSTQPGYAGVPRVELRGDGAGSAANGLYLLGSNCTIRALCINRFGGEGILVEGFGSNVVQGCYIGTTLDGRSAAANTRGGVTVRSPGNVIGGSNASERNVISGGNQGGVFLLDAYARYNQVLGNFIGMDATGTNRLGNVQNGILISSAAENQVGGSAPGAGNVISANGQSGVYVMWPGARGNRVEGNLIGTDASGFLARGNLYGVTILDGNSNVVGGVTPAARNVISGNATNGVHITSGPSGGGTGNVIQGNYIGTDITGTKAVANGARGIEIYRASGNRVGGGNVISGNAFSGAVLTGGNCTNNQVAGNLIGTDRFGTNAVPNGFDGVLLVGVSNNIVGGLTEAERNVLSGNLWNGVLLAGSNTRSNAILGNYIGTSVSGRQRLGNGFSGVRIEGPQNLVGGASPGAGNVISANLENGVFLHERAASNNIVAGNLIGLDATGNGPLGNGVGGVGLTNAPDNLIGGATPGAGNVISANVDSGIYLQAALATRNAIQGNILGADVSGIVARGNGRDGISGYDAPSNTVGGAIVAQRNIVSGNGWNGFYLSGAGTAGWTIQGNYIGTQADGWGILGNNFHNVEMINGSLGHTIGGANSGEGNRIAYARGAGWDGVRVRDGSTGNRIVGNAIFANGGASPSGLGIDLGVDGVTPNDTCDTDTGGNLLQNFPILMEAHASATATAIRGSLTSAAGGTYQIHFYANPTNEPSGYGEGQFYLGQITVRTAANCTTNFSANLSAGTPAGHVITATATDAMNNTSEFSQGIIVRPQPVLAASHSPATRLLTLSWTNSAQGFTLQQTTNLSAPAVWSPVTNSPVLSGGRFLVSLAATNASRYYRLILP